MLGAKSASVGEGGLALTGFLIYTGPARGGSDDGRGLIVVSGRVDELIEFEIYSYTVRARDAAGNLSSHSAKVTVTAADPGSIT